VGVFLRYVGNRLHILFHSAGIIILYLKELKKFVELGGTNLKKSIKEELDDPRVVAQLIALGLIGKTVTGPWMTKFYANSMNLDMVPVIQSSKNVLDRFAAEPEELLCPTVNVFNEPIDAASDMVLTAIINNIESHRDKVKQTLKQILHEIVKVFDRQFVRYTSGDLSSPTVEQLTQASTAPSHNMAAERILGMTDYLWRRAPNATAGFVDGKVRGRTNDTVGWLLQQDKMTQHRLVYFAMKEGYRARELAAQRKKMMEAVMMRRMLEAGQKHEQSNRKALEKEVAMALSAKDLNASVFSSASPEVMGLIAMYITSENPMSELTETYTGHLLKHLWTEEGVDKMYSGRVVNFKQQKTKTMKCTITYWGPDELETDSVDYDMTMTSLVTDLLTGDLVFSS
jgi:hypothetical protein